MKAIIERYGSKEIVQVLSFQIVPQITFERNDLEYTLRQDNETHMIYVDKHGDIDTINCDVWTVKVIPDGEDNPTGS